jgi:hemoglobin/transferrin/lactoferrin receptor protein
MEEGNNMLTKKFTAGIPKLLPCALLVLAMASAAAQAGMHSGTFHLAAQTLDKALAAYASTTGIHLRIEAAIPAGTNAKSLHGTLTDAEALRQLLVGSGLGYRFVDAHTVVISAVPQQIAQAGVTQLGTLRVEGEGVQYLWGDASAAGNRALNRTMADHPYTTPGSSNHVSREQIDRASQSAVGEIFRETAGVLAAGSHNASGLDINIRGLQGMDRVNILVDGTQQNSSQYIGYRGSTSSVYVDQDFISGIDITKGPDGGQFGSASMGGVVNMRTLDATDIVPDGKKYGFIVKGSLGSNTNTPVVGSTTLRRENPGINGDAYHYSIAAGALFDPASVMIGIARRKTGNYVSGSQFNGKTTAYSTIAKSQEVLNSSQNSTSETIKIKPTLAASHSLELGYTHYYDSHGELNEYILLYPTLLTYAQGTLANTQTHTASIRYILHPENNPWLNLHANLWGSHIRTKHGLQAQWTGSEYNAGFPTTSFGSELFNSSSLPVARFGQLDFKYGLSFSQENANGTTKLVTSRGTTYPLGDPEGKRILGSVYAQAVDHLNSRIALHGGLRYDRYHGNGHGYYDSIADQDRGRINGSAGLTVAPVKGTQLFVNYARGWRPPSIREAYWQFTTLLMPNASLKPETTDNIEFGLNLSRTHLFDERDSAHFKFAYFNNRYGNYIVRNRPTGYTYYLWQNLDRAEYRGIELQGDYTLPYLFAQGSYTKYTHINYCAVGAACSGSALSTDYYGGTYIPPSYSGSGTIGTHLLDQKLTGSLTANYWARRAGISGFTPSYIAPAAWPNSIVLNSSLSYKPTRNLEVGASGENLTDRYYIDPVSVAVQAAPGRTFRLNATYRF